MEKEWVTQRFLTQLNMTIQNDFKIIIDFYMLIIGYFVIFILILFLRKSLKISFLKKKKKSTN